SPHLFAAVFASGRYRTAVLTQRNAAGDPEAEWVLGAPTVAFDSVASGGSTLPTETLYLDFDSVTEVTSANTASWDHSANIQRGPAARVGVALVGLPPLSAPALTLALQPMSGSNMPTVTLGLDSYQFGVYRGGFSFLKLSAPLSGASPQLFAALVGQHPYDM